MSKNSEARRRTNRISTGGRRVLQVDHANHHQPASADSAWKVHEFVGEKPPFYDLDRQVMDTKQRRLYIYGGCPDGAKDDRTPTSGFYCCDLRTKRWENFSNRLRFRQPSKPFSILDSERTPKPLPALLEPAIAFTSMNSGSYVFLFGGYHAETDRTTANLIVINIKQLEWWYVDVKGGAIYSRANAAMCIIRNKIFIFGGKDLGNNDAPLWYNLYSVAEYGNDDEWRWVICDQPYFPKSVSAIGFNVKATPVLDGKKIILTPGKTCSDSPTDFSPKNIVFFHVENYSFHVATDTVGDFPRGILWYDVFVLDHPRCSPASSRRSDMQARLDIARKRSSISDPSTTTPAPSLIICGWRECGKFLIPELWHYLLPHDDKIKCLNYHDKIFDLDQDIQGSYLIDGHFYLMGSKDDYYCKNRRWNIYVEVPLPVP